MTVSFYIPASTVWDVHSYACLLKLVMVFFYFIFSFFSHCNKWVVVSHCGSHLNLPKMTAEWGIFHVLNCYLYILFGEVSVDLLPIYIWFFLLLCFDHYLYILDTKSFI